MNNYNGLFAGIVLYQSSFNISHFFKLIFLLCFFPLSSFAQLQGDIKNAPSATIYLSSFYGIKATLIDSTVLNKKGSFKFNPPAPYPTGFYRLHFNDTNYTDIILTPKEKVIFYSGTGNLRKDIAVENSLENRLLQETINYRANIGKEIKKIIIDASYLDKKDSLYNVLLLRKDSLNRAFDDFLKEQIEKHPGTYFALTSAGLVTPSLSDFPDLADKYQNNERLFLKEHFFDDIDFSNPGLMRTTLLPNRYMKYFESYVDYDEAGFKHAVDLILSKAEKNPAVYELSLEYLLELFNKVGPEVIAEYIIENYYLKNSCVDFQNDSLMAKINRYKSLVPGAVAPDVILPDTSGKLIPLSEVAAAGKATIVFFWSSHCGFCEQVQPVLKELYRKYKSKGLQIYSISLDENEQEWKAAVGRYEGDWINVTELKGWNTAAARAYMINRTPTIYILDKWRKIVAKNVQEKDIEEQVKKLLN